MKTKIKNALQWAALALIVISAIASAFFAIPKF